MLAEFYDTFKFKNRKGDTFVLSKYDEGVKCVVHPAENPEIEQWAFCVDLQENYYDYVDDELSPYPIDCDVTFTYCDNAIEMHKITNRDLYIRSCIDFKSYPDSDDNFDYERIDSDQSVPFSGLFMCRSQEYGVAIDVIEKNKEYAMYYISDELAWPLAILTFEEDNTLCIDLPLFTGTKTNRYIELERAKKRR